MYIPKWRQYYFIVSIWYRLRMTCLSACKYFCIPACTQFFTCSTLAEWSNFTSMYKIGYFPRKCSAWLQQGPIKYLEYPNMRRFSYTKKTFIAFLCTLFYEYVNPRNQIKVKCFFDKTALIIHLCMKATVISCHS